MPNEVIITIRARNEIKPVFDQVERDAAQLGRTVGRVISTTTTETIRTRASSGPEYRRAGEAIGETIGRSAGQRIADRIRDAFRRTRSDIDREINRARSGGLGPARDSRGRFVGGGNGGAGGNATVDVDRQSVLQRIGGLARDIGGKVTGILGGAVSTFFGGDFITLIIKAVAGAGLAQLLAGVIGGAISSAILLVLGGGVIAIGIASALKDPRIQGAIGDLKGRFTRAFEDFGTAFKGPVARFLEAFLGVMDQIKPQVQGLANVFGPITDKLGAGFIGFLQNALPPILRAAEAAGPIFEMLADKLPGLGDDLGDFFDDIASSGPNAAIFFGDLIELIGDVIAGLGDVVASLTHMYVAGRVLTLRMTAAFADMAFKVVGLMAMAFSWIPGLGPKMQAAAAQVGRFKNRINNEIRGMIDEKTITIRIRQVFSTVGSAAVNVGNILSRRASGGVIGTAATGGIRSGLTWVGERGPELIAAPAGSQVHSAGDSARMAAKSGGGFSGPIIVQAVLDGRVLAEAIADPMRRFVGERFGGNVQNAYGQ